ncbi:hypothetical protein CEXT_386431 [Caerostris extrusa]|uniref:Uncharacterized protein n=1 Tax=Caerostris extrusa TaxID=172846 RepID=A0AAV4W9S9_CAEEX|nr:hypothetical protein CEXT_386431 [Caerostris extrusa]
MLGGSTTGEMDYRIGGAREGGGNERKCSEWCWGRFVSDSVIREFQYPAQSKRCLNRFEGKYFIQSVSTEPEMG